MIFLTDGKTKRWRNNWWAIASLLTNIAWVNLLLQKKWVGPKQERCPLTQNHQGYPSMVPSLPKVYWLHQLNQVCIRSYLYELGTERYPTMHFTSASESSSNSTKCVPQCLDVQVWTPEVHESVPAYWGPRNSFKTFVIHWPAVRVGVVRVVRVRGETPKAVGLIYLTSLPHPWLLTFTPHLSIFLPTPNPTPSSLRPIPIPTPDHLLTPDRPHPPHSWPNTLTSPTPHHPSPSPHPWLSIPVIWPQWLQVKQSEVL